MNYLVGVRLPAKVGALLIFFNKNFYKSKGIFLYLCRKYGNQTMVADEDKLNRYGRAFMETADAMNPYTDENVRDRICMVLLGNWYEELSWLQLIRLSYLKLENTITWGLYVARFTNMFLMKTRDFIPYHMSIPLAYILHQHIGSSIGYAERTQLMNVHYQLVMGHFKKIKKVILHFAKVFDFEYVFFNKKLNDNRSWFFPVTMHRGDYIFDFIRMTTDDRIHKDYLKKQLGGTYDSAQTVFNTFVHEIVKDGRFGIDPKDLISSELSAPYIMRQHWGFIQESQINDDVFGVKCFKKTNKDYEYK